MDVWLIHKDGLSGTELLGPAFIDEVACRNFCKEHHSDFIDYIPVKKEAEEISKERVIVDLRVFPLDRTEGKTAIIRRALSKLTTEEIKALGINPTGEKKETPQPEIEILNNNKMIINR